MARMKKLIPILFALLLFLPVKTAAAHADGLRYAVAADSNVWFYTGESEEEKLFLLPETYYVRVLYEGETFSTVEYLVNDPPYRKLVGYCRTAALTFVDFIPARPFLRREVTLTYSLPASGTLGDTFGSVERTFVYYGSRYENGQLYYYVLADGQFGFVPAAEELVFEKNDDFLSVPSAPVGGSEDASGTGTASKAPTALQIVLIVLACVAAVVIAILVLKAKRHTAFGKDEEE